MDVLFLQNIWFEVLGTMSLAASLRKAGVHVDLAIGKDRELLKSVRNNAPRVVAFSCVTGSHGWALQLARRIRTEIDPKIHIVMGGPHTTFFPEIIDEYPVLDAICLGEGETAMVEYINVLDDPDRLRRTANFHLRIEGTVYRNEVRPLIGDLDTLPLMERTIYYKYNILKNNPVKRMISGRGCPYDCAFCFNHSAMQIYKGKGPYVRKRSIESVLEEVQWLKDRYPVTTIRFEDDLFGLNKKWLFSFCEAYPRHFKIPFICSMRADSIDRDVVKALKDAGCFNVVIGVETGDESLRNTVLKKNISDECLRNAAALFNEYKLNFCTTNILGLPGETLEQALKTIRFNIELKPAFTWCSVFQPYPRTALGAFVLEKKLVSSLDVDDIEPNYHSNSLLRQPDIKRSVNLHKFFYLIFNYPFLLPVAKWLSVFPPNVLFTLIHRISFLFIYARRWNIPLRRAVREAVKTSGFTRKVRPKNE